MYIGDEKIENLTLYLYFYDNGTVTLSSPQLYEWYPECEYTCTHETVNGTYEFTEDTLTINVTIPGEEALPQTGKYNFPDSDTLKLINHDTYTFKRVQD